jgi:hypothetical protein
MKGKAFVKSHGSGCVVTVDASPSATRNEIVGVNPWRGALQVRIAAEPREGAANDELVRFLADTLALPRSSVRLLRGERSSRKVVYLPIRAERALAALEGK